MSMARCAIYETRPQICRDYPTAYHWTPDVCTYTFPAGVHGKREGDCACGVGACCATPRAGGEPGGAPMPEEAGGSACKHLIWEEEEPTKTASESVHLDSSASGRQSLLRVLGHDD